MSELLIRFVSKLALVLIAFGLIEITLWGHNRYEMEKLRRKGEEIKLLWSIDDMMLKRSCRK